MKVIWGLLALGLLGVFVRAIPSSRHSLFDDSERTLIRVTRSDLDDEEPRVEHHKKVEKKRSTEEHLKRSRRAQQEDEFFQALLSRSAKTKNEQKRSFEDNGSESKGFIIRDDWKGDSKISDADRTELENLFSAINAPVEKKEEKRSSHDDKMYEFTQWLVSQSSAMFAKSLNHIVDVEQSLSKMIYNDDIIKKLKARKAQMLSDLVAKNETKSKETKLDDKALSDDKARKEFCKTKCYDINVAGINCRIICHPPHIDNTGGVQMQQLPYQACSDPNCGMGIGQSPCAPQGCVPGYPQTAGYPQPYNPYGGVVPPTTVYSPNRGLGHFHQHGKHHAEKGKEKEKKDKKDKKVKKESKDKKDKKEKKDKKPKKGKAADKHPVLKKQHDDSSNSTGSSGSSSSSSSSSSSDKKKKKKKVQKMPEIPDTENIDKEYEYEGPGEENELEYEHPHWLHHRTDHKKGAFGEGEGGGGGGGGGGAAKSIGGGKPKYGPVTLNTLGATVHITPMSFSTPGGPSMPPAGIQVGPPNPNMVNPPMLPQQPYYNPMNPYGVPPLYPAAQDETAATQDDAAATQYVAAGNQYMTAGAQYETAATGTQEASARSFKPMPKDCKDYSHKKCQVFLDWPTDENNEIKASLRFKQNWHPDYRRKSSTKYKILKNEVEKALRDSYTKDPNFLAVDIKSFSEEDMKTAANFVLKFYQPENGALRWLSKAISNDYLMSMPVYSTTLLRDGLKHVRRNFVSRQKVVDKLPSKPVEKTSKKKSSSLLDSESKAYQGCYKDKKPDRDLPVRFSKFAMTPEWCVGRCKLAGYKYAGLQYAYLCFCGNKFGKYGKVEDKDCSSHCYGDKNRFCGSFWHNSVYSIDGQKHSIVEFANAKDDDDDDEDDEGSANEDPSKKLSDKEHAEVATHLMKAAEAALKAAKKLLPQGKKERRDAESELEQEKARALSALGAAESVMENNQRQKRDAELHEGRDLLVSYLGNVGGYDRQYRSVDSQEEGEENAPKFEYKRMLIDESGDGEFVEKDNEKEKKHKRSVSHDVSKRRRRRRSVTVEEEPTVKAVEKRESTKPATADKPKTAAVEKVDKAPVVEDKVEKKEEKKADKPKVAATKEVEKKPVVEKKETKKEKRSDKPEEKELHRSRRELVEEEEEKPTKEKRDIWLDDSKSNEMEKDINDGIDSSLAMLLDIFKSQKTLENFRESILRLKEDVAAMISVPKYQKSEVKAKIRAIIDKELPKKTTAFMKKLRNTIGEYGVSHAVVAPQVSEAEKAILDLPVLETVAKKAKSNIEKRSAVLADEIKKAAMDNLPSILKEHFKRNTEDDSKRRKRSSDRQ